MRSIVGATQREQRLGLALNWCVSRSGVRAAPRSQSVPYSQPVDRLKRSGVASSGKTAYRKADDLWARFKVSEWRVFCHMARLRNSPPRLKLVLSDTAVINHSIIWGLILMATGSIGFSTVLSGLVLQDLL